MPTEAEGTIRKAALGYARKGFPVLPLVSKGKTPLVSRGVHDATTDAKQIREWWRQWPDANVGIVPPLVIDLDPRNGGTPEALREHGPIPRTLTARTGGGGWHLYFAVDDLPDRLPKLGPGIDLKYGPGMYVVAPPSIHASGEPYRWQTLTAMAPAPDWLLDAAPSRSERLPDKLTRGGRNTGLAKLAGAMRRVGASEQAILAALQDENRRRCKPPLPEAEVRKIAGSIGRYEPHRERQDDSVRLEAVWASDVKPRAINWLWPGYLAVGKIHIKCGPPGVAKSMGCGDIAARLSRGDEWPDGSPGTKGRTLIISAEDDAADTIVPRLIAAGADLSQIRIMQRAVNDEGLDADFNVHDGAENLRALIRDTGAVYVVLDPLVAYIGKVDAHRDSEVRQALSRLLAIAEDEGCAIECVMHLNKGRELSALQRIGGSVAFGALARLVTGVVKDPDEEGRYVYGAIKANIAATDDSSLSYRIVTELVLVEAEDGSDQLDAVPRIEWLGKAETDVEQVMSSTVRQGNRLTEAKDFLLSLLTHEPTPQKNLEAEAKDAGISPRTLRRAKDELKDAGKVIVRKVGGNKPHWTWELSDGKKTKSP